jgi:hypothetical protein
MVGTLHRALLAAQVPFCLSQRGADQLTREMSYSRIVVVAPHPCPSLRLHQSADVAPAVDVAALAPSPLGGLVADCGDGVGLAVCPALGQLVTSSNATNTLSVFNWSQPAMGAPSVCPISAAVPAITAGTSSDGCRPAPYPPGATTGFSLVCTIGAPQALFRFGSQFSGVGRSGYLAFLGALQRTTACWSPTPATTPCTWWTWRGRGTWATWLLPKPFGGPAVSLRGVPAWPSARGGRCGGPSGHNSTARCACLRAAAAWHLLGATVDHPRPWRHHPWQSRWLAPSTQWSAVQRGWGRGCRGRQCHGPCGRVQCGRWALRATAGPGPPLPCGCAGVHGGGGGS